MPAPRRIDRLFPWMAGARRDPRISFTKAEYLKLPMLQYPDPGTTLQLELTPPNRACCRGTAVRPDYQPMQKLARRSSTQLKQRDQTFLVDPGFNIRGCSPPRVVDNVGQLHDEPDMFLEGTLAKPNHCRFAKPSRDRRSSAQRGGPPGCPETDRASLQARGGSCPPVPVPERPVLARVTTPSRCSTLKPAFWTARDFEGSTFQWGEVPSWGTCRSAVPSTL